MIKVSAQWEYSGLSDYWGGNGRRWDDDAACVFAFYGPESSLRSLLDQWVADDSDMDGKPLWRDVSDSDIESAILDCFTDAAKADLDSICSLAREYGEINGHDYNLEDFDAESVECDCCQEYGDSPMAVILLTLSEDADAS